MKLSKIVCALIVFSALIVGCAKPPKAEMDQAEAAVSRAENNADAVTYGGNSLSRAKDALNRMRTEANAKRYEAAKTYAAEAVAAADKAIADGQAGAIRARDEASALVAGLRPALDETEQGIRNAKTAKLNVDVDGAFETARQNVEQAEAALSGNNYSQAMERGRGAQAGLSAINQQLSSAAMAVSRKK